MGVFAVNGVQWSRPDHRPDLLWNVSFETRLPGVESALVTVGQEAEMEDKI